MWAKIRRFCDPPSTRTALEVVREDGTISTDLREILMKWHKDISRLFSGIRDNPELVFDGKFCQEVLDKADDRINQETSGSFQFHRIIPLLTCLVISSHPVLSCCADLG